MDKTIGHVAYSKYAELLPYPTVVPQWEDLPASAKAGWEEIALAAVNQHIDDGLRNIDRTLDAQMGESDG